MQAIPCQSIPRSSRVRILDDRLVNQIAAGEVVERPASVVKELVENALDARASEVSVVIENGGKSSIVVLDNGCGLSKEDALLAIERYGTSKIRTLEDLQAVGTLGFRGEALPSIAAVSRFALSSRAEDLPSAAGVELRIEGGVLKEVLSRDLAQGTRIEVRQLFYNVPARRKFLRADATETGLIKSQIIDYALAYPAVRFRLVAEGKELLNIAPLSLSSDENFISRARSLKIAGDNAITGVEERKIAESLLRLRYALSVPVACVADSGRLRFLVNGRSVRDKILVGAVRNGYGNFLASGKYPAGVLSLELAAEEVDVNVHPQKTEVRFRCAAEVFRAISSVVREALERIAPEPISAPFKQTFSPQFTSRTEASFFSPAKAEAAGFTPLEPQPAVIHQSHILEAERGPMSSDSLLSMRFVGQVFGVYLILEGEGRLALLDMHAAHERVVFYRVKKQFLAGPIEAQSLLISESVNVPPELSASLAHNLEILQRLGLTVELTGEDSAAVHTVPAVLGNISGKALLEDLLSLPYWSDWRSLLEGLIDQVLARIACHGSVRRGRILDEEEVFSLIKELQQVEASGLCPHGRPVVFYLTERELETRFGRVI